MAAVCEAVGLMLKLHRAGGGAGRRRLIKLSSAGWIPRGGEVMDLHPIQEPRRRGRTDWARASATSWTIKGSTSAARTARSCRGRDPTTVRFGRWDSTDGINHLTCPRDVADADWDSANESLIIPRTLLTKLIAKNY